ncbi:hypothetical protein [Aquimarina algiphila]|uniref:Uncharacterized protein n=1 Tax=Aquimarina algiphila TaxID=2047982 RepID=A0A554VIE0_9FLAO|nr:hypothetical protein [Aquimarina algiphila]TSE07420.1 hypothetical protein FOF46_16010 [Aquimarina algiphila]
MAQKTTKKINGIKVKVSSYKLNLLAYKEIAGRVVIKASNKKIKQKNVKVEIDNFYFGVNPHPSPNTPVLLGKHHKPSFEKKYTTARHFAVGIGVKLKIGGSPIEVSPSLPSGLVNLPISGVITKATITVGGKTETITTQKGKVGSIF